MLEAASELADLQKLFDTSLRWSGEHLRGIIRVVPRWSVAYAYAFDVAALG